MCLFLKCAHGLRFLDEARRAGCVVHEASSAAAGVAGVLGLIGGDAAVSSWELGHIPLPGLAAALNGAGVVRVGQDAAVRVGLTGADEELIRSRRIIASRLGQEPRTLAYPNGDYTPEIAAAAAGH